jgi:tRNA threonylcarbamoyl adenosine modification protein YjeE
MQKQFTRLTLEDAKKLAEILGSRLGCGDVVTLSGDLGAGKTTFAQFLIQGLSPEPVEVTSPTFTLLQTYPVTLADGSAQELYHYDLYRIEHPSALIELGFEEAFEHVTLIEWPERAEGMKLPVTLALAFLLMEDGGRSVTLSGDARLIDGLIV